MLSLKTISFVFLFSQSIQYIYNSPTLRKIQQVSNGYGSKIACSAVFVSHREIQDVNSKELLFPPIKILTAVSVVKDLQGDVEVDCVLGKSRINKKIFTKSCYYGDVIGCRLSIGDVSPPLIDVNDVEFQRVRLSDEELFDSLPSALESSSSSSSSSSSTVDYEQLDKIGTMHLTDTSLNVRALLVIQNGVLIYEKYSDNFTADTRHGGWSMTKSLMNALFGLASTSSELKDISLDTVVSFTSLTNPEVSSAWINRNATISNFLNMEDGLDWEEWYEPTYLVTDMLFVNSTLYDVNSVPVFREDGVGCFRYSSQTSNILSSFLRASYEREYGVELGYKKYRALPMKLFNALGITSGTIDTSADGTFAMSSFSYLTPKDWAKFGMLYASGGLNYKGEQIIPREWVDFGGLKTASSDGYYGGGFWIGGSSSLLGDGELKQRSRSDQCDSIYPSRLNPSREWLREAWPEGTFLAHGFEENVVAIVPKKNVVVVRLGASKEWRDWTKKKVTFYQDFLEAIPDVV